MANKDKDEQAKKKKGGAAKWLVIPILAIAAFLLRDCIPGFGWGGAAGDGSAANSAGASSATPPTSASAVPTTSASAKASAPIVITVKGDKCGEQDCEAACKEALDEEGPVIVEAAAGSHAVVEALEKCLVEGGRKPSISTK